MSGMNSVTTTKLPYSKLSEVQKLMRQLIKWLKTAEITYPRVGIQMYH